MVPGPPRRGRRPRPLSSVPASLAAARELGPWLDDLAELGPAPSAVVLPPPESAAAVLAQIGVPDDEIPAIVATLPSPTADPDRWWVLERAHHRLTAGLARSDEADAVGSSPGGRGPWGAWPPIPASLGPGWEWFHVHLYLAAVPDVLRLHERAGIAPDVTWATLGNVGRNVAIHRELHGSPGLHAPDWLVLLVRGQLFHVGRLQYQRARATWSTPGAPFAIGHPVLDLHIPPTGPLAPPAVDRSFLEARAFFGRHFPADDSAHGVCTSWLLDPQLRAYLPDDSNILRFQQRFQLDDDWSFTDDASIVEFVFRRAATPPDELPRRTTLECAVVDHIRGRGHWQTRRGWCAVPRRELA